MEKPKNKSTADQYRAVNVEISTSHNPDLKNLAIPHYTAEEHETWSLMFKRQRAALPDRASTEFLIALEKLKLPENRIPRLKEVSEILEKSTGWKLTRVAGLVPEKEFFGLLAQKLFPCTDFIRKREELEYTPSPDMFHDIFGHIPLITNSYFASFYESFGKAALRANADQVLELQRIYWFTVEFGLIQNPEGARIYGSGILSSVSEVQNCLGPSVRVHPFDYSVVERQYYEIHHMQDDLFTVPSFEWLAESFENYCKKKSLL